MPEQKEFAVVGLPMEVQDAMRNHLPQMMNKLLRDELNKGESAIADNVQLRQDIQRVEKRLDEHGTIARDRRLIKDETDNLKTLLAKVKREQFDLNLTIAQIKLESAEKYAAKLEGCLSGLVRNTAWRETVLATDVIESRSTGDGGFIETKIPTDTKKVAT